jgi:hypothetical protein
MWRGAWRERLRPGRPVKSGLRDARVLYAGYENCEIFRLSRAVGGVDARTGAEGGVLRMAVLSTGPLSRLRTFRGA